MSRVHGGPDTLGIPAWDFSTNANACGPCTMALEAVRAVEPTHYPDPAYGSLRAALAEFHGVASQRIVLAASGSEAIARVTAWVARRGGRRVSVPEHAFGDYAQLAQAWGMALQTGDAADLRWGCEPSSPLGQAWQPHATVGQSGVTVLDRAYEPLRLDGQPSLNESELQQVWQLWTPNKALGLTGVRGAYLIAPVGAEAGARQLEALGPSWPLGAHAVAMLRAWTQPATQRWLAATRDVLRRWRTSQRDTLEALGWSCLPSQANFFCARPPTSIDADALRSQGIKLRDATSFGLPGYWRLSVQPPVAQQALVAALQGAAAPTSTAQHRT
ncbi:aminotransferase class I/II-fold pyridoxal phosphate-dependent enzyme [Hydrogenophaga aquatica]